MNISALPSSLSSTPSTELRGANSWSLNFCKRHQVLVCQLEKSSSGRQVWRRRKLSKKDDMRKYRMERTPFLEEQVRRVREGGGLLAMDVERLLLSEDNRFAFVNEVAAEANAYVERNRDEYGGTKKAIFHVLSNRMNDIGIYRPEAYVEPDPFKPGPGYLRREST